MIASSYTQQSSSAFDFSMQTSSGDKINLSAFRESEVEIGHFKDDSLDISSLSLKQTYGYSFSYSGNGIDKQDRKEIDEALKEIKPLLNFLDLEIGFKADDKSISDKALDINALLPKAKDDNHQNFIKDSLVDMMDEMLEAFDANDDMLKLARDVFDVLEKQMKGLMLYA
jgi:hypothetical protein